jgi:hemoglobin
MKELLITPHSHPLPTFTSPDPQIYALLGEDGFRAFIHRFYTIVSEDNTIAHFFPEEGPDLDQARQNAADFFIQACGGPNWFDQRRGGMSMAEAHKRFSVTPKAREGWLHCLRTALYELKEIDDSLKESFWSYCDSLSQHIVNVQAEKIKLFEEMAKKS